MADQGSAALKAASTVSITAVVIPGLGSLWSAYLAAAETYETLNRNWRMIAPVARADGTAGSQYAKVYTAEQAKNAAYTAWITAWRLVYPTPPSGTGTLNQD